MQRKKSIPLYGWVVDKFSLEIVLGNNIDYGKLMKHAISNS